MGSPPTEISMPLAPEEDEEACLLATKLVVGSALQMAVRSAVELGLFEILVEAGPQAQLIPADAVAQLCPAARDPLQAATMVDRILRVLAANGIVKCAVDDGGDGLRYGPAPVCKYLTKDLMGAWHLMLHDKDMMETWSVSLYRPRVQPF